MLLQAADDRRRQHDIAYGAEPDDEVLFHRMKGLLTFSYPIDVSGPCPG
jgi:hypothetical protein